MILATGVLRDEITRRPVVAIQRDAVAGEVDQEPVVGLDLPWQGFVENGPQVGQRDVLGQQADCVSVARLQNLGNPAGVMDCGPERRDALAVVVDPDHDSVALPEPDHGEQSP